MTVLIVVVYDDFYLFFFFFQAEDGIRDLTVTGVQTCALPISYPVDIHNPDGKGTVLRSVPAGDAYDVPLRCLLPRDVDDLLTAGRCISGTHERSEERRVGKECRSRWWPTHS